uniref:TraB domain containing protein n=1 Tax=Echinococcus granulosus TaxID=6210 RepID=A0A068W7Y1_ECHGR|nr:traB domain containing protein [Echinococcus granulosus]
MNAYAACSDSEGTGDSYEMNAISSFLECVQIVRRTPFELPKTVSLIECSNGTKVYLVGTAHFSKESIADVRFIMEKTLPDFVVVELCRNRSHSMLLSEDDIKRQIRENSLVDYVRNMGVSNGVLQYLLLRFTKYIMEQIGMAPGGEFRAAFQEASKQAHCHLILGDRPIKVTLQRAMDALGLWQKTRFFFSLLFGFEEITPEDVEEMKSEDLLEQLIKALAGDYPELTRIILEERDLYLARSIWEVCGLPSEEPGHDANRRGEEVDVEEDEEEKGAEVRQRQEHDQKRRESDKRSENSTVEVLLDPEEHPHLLRQCCCWCPEWPGLDVLPRVVVAVVGIGHVAGIRKAWNHAATIDKAELRRVKPASRSWVVVRWASRALILSVSGWSPHFSRHPLPVFEIHAVLMPQSAVWPITVILPNCPQHLLHIFTGVLFRTFQTYIDVY